MKHDLRVGEVVRVIYKRLLNRFPIEFDWTFKRTRHLKPIIHTTPAAGAKIAEEFDIRTAFTEDIGAMPYIMHRMPKLGILHTSAYCREFKM